MEVGGRPLGCWNARVCFQKTSPPSRCSPPVRPSLLQALPPSGPGHPHPFPCPSLDPRSFSREIVHTLPRPCLNASCILQPLRCKQLLGRLHDLRTFTWLYGAQAQRIAPLAGFHSSCKKSDAVLRELRRKYFLRGSIVLTHCVLPPVHVGQDLVYSSITEIAIVLVSVVLRVEFQRIALPKRSVFLSFWMSPRTNSANHNSKEVVGSNPLTTDFSHAHH